MGRNIPKLVILANDLCSSITKNLSKRCSCNMPFLRKQESRCPRLSSRPLRESARACPGSTESPRSEPCPELAEGLSKDDGDNRSSESLYGRTGTPACPNVGAQCLVLFRMPFLPPSRNPGCTVGLKLARALKNSIGVMTNTIWCY